MVGQKNSTQPNLSHKSNPTHIGRVGQIIIIIIIKLSRKKYKYNYIKKTQRLVLM